MLVIVFVQSLIVLKNDLTRESLTMPANDVTNQSLHINPSKRSQGETVFPAPDSSRDIFRENIMNSMLHSSKKAFGASFIQLNSRSVQCPLSSQLGRRSASTTTGEPVEYGGYPKR